MECSPPGSSVHGILQAKMLEWVAILFSRGSSQPRDWTWVSCIAGRFFTIWATREAQNYTPKKLKKRYIQNPRTPLPPQPPPCWAPSSSFLWVLQQLLGWSSWFWHPHPPLSILHTEATVSTDTKALSLVTSLLSWKPFMAPISPKIKAKIPPARPKWSDPWSPSDLSSHCPALAYSSHMGLTHPQTSLEHDPSHHSPRSSWIDIPPPPATFSTQQ